MSKKYSANTKVNVMRLLKKTWHRKFFILFVALTFCTATLLVNIFLITPRYTSTTCIYMVEQDSSDILTAKEFSDYKEIITSNDVLSSVVEQEGENLSASELRGMLTVEMPKDTHVIAISVEDKSSQEAADFANTIGEVASEKIKEVTKVDDVTSVEAAEVSTTPSSPNVKRNIIIATVIGWLIALIGVLTLEILDDYIRHPEDVEDVLGITLLGVVPDTEQL